MVTELKIVGGDPALDLVNTLGDDRVPDPLEDYGYFVAWTARVGVIDDETAGQLAARARDYPATGERAHAAARDLREVLDAVFRPLASAAGRSPVTGRDPQRDALARLVALAGAAIERGVLVDADGGFGLAWGGDHLERPLWPLATAAVDLLRSGPLERLKACEGCPWLFLDTSRNHSRRWCSMDDCGSRSKMRRYRARRATAGR